MSATPITPALSPTVPTVPVVPPSPVTPPGGPASGRAGYPRFGDAVEGRDGALGTVVGTRSAGDGSELAYVLVRQARAWGLWHQTRCVPLSWMREWRPGFAGVTLNASRAEVAGCPPLRPDGDIRADVAATLWPQGSSPRAPQLRLSVRDGVVELTGHTGSPRETMAVLERAWRVPGVLGVRSRVADDEALTGAVAQALTADPGTRAAHLQVRVRLGSVELDGRVPTRATHEAATALARAVPGVAAVTNSAEIVPTPAPRPATSSGEAL